MVIKIDALTGERLADDAEGPNVITEVFQLAYAPEIIGEKIEIPDDRELFRGVTGDDLPMTLDADEVYTPPVATEGGARRPPPPPKVGLGTGGLY